MELSKQTQEKINQMSLIEENLKHILARKHSYQTDQLEINNALTELETAQGQVYKITGPIMILTDKEHVKIELEEKKEESEIKLQSIEKQEEKLKQKAQSIQDEVIKEMETKK